MTTTSHPTRRTRSVRVRLATVAAIGAALTMTMTGAAQAVAQPAPVQTAAAACESCWPTPYQVCDQILDLYTSLGGPSGSLSYPASNAVPAGDNVGTRQTFLAGAICYSPATGAIVE